MTLNNDDSQEKTLSIYIHWPFCIKKCPYCSFNSHVSNDINFDLWINAYIKEIDYYSSLIKNKKIISIFFGGGTPTTSSPELVEKIINRISKYGKISNETEITLEANPSSSDIANINEFKKNGVNRISLGVQSFNDDSLTFLGRTHNANQALKVIDVIATLFENYSFDLIYALPQQEVNEWTTELKEALRFVKNHISLYQLSVDKGTKFYRDFSLGVFKEKNEESCFEMYYKTKEILEDNGFDHYEVSNYCRFDKKCIHNMNYWLYGHYLGIGPGACSRMFWNDNLYDIRMISDPDKWIQSSSGDNGRVQFCKSLSQEEQAIELIAMNMRTNRGVVFSDFLKKIGKDIDFFINKKKLFFLKKNGFINCNDNSMSITEINRLITDHIIKLLLF